MRGRLPLRLLDLSPVREDRAEEIEGRTRTRGTSIESAIACIVTTPLALLLSVASVATGTTSEKACCRSVSALRRAISGEKRGNEILTRYSSQCMHFVMAQAARLSSACCCRKLFQQCLLDEIRRPVHVALEVH